MSKRSLNIRNELKRLQELMKQARLTEMELEVLELVKELYGEDNIESLLVRLRGELKRRGHSQQTK